MVRSTRPWARDSAKRKYWFSTVGRLDGVSKGADSSEPLWNKPMPVLGTTNMRRQSRAAATAEVVSTAARARLRMRAAPPSWANAGIRKMARAGLKPQISKPRQSSTATLSHENANVDLHF